MVSPRGLQGFTVVLALLAIGFVGCLNFGDEDDPLVNPNIGAVMTTGETGSTSSGTGTSGPGILTINPTSVRIAINEAMTFTAAGGEPPYSFSLISSPPNGNITAGGVYTAGATGGSDRVRVTDSSGTFSDADVMIYDPASEPSPYRIVCTDVTPPASAVVVPTGGTVNFRIENGTPPDSFNVTHMSGTPGGPQGFLPASRVGGWMTGNTGANDGSIVDLLQVFDSSSPLNVAVLKIYVCLAANALGITPTWVVVPTNMTQDFTASPTGVGTLSWTVTVAQSGATPMQVLTATSARYTPGNNTQGIYGAADVVQVEDSFPQPPQANIPHQVAQAKVTVPGLSVFPREPHIRPSSSIQFYALGGSGSYSWTLVQNRSGSGTGSGSLSPFTFNAGAGEGLDILQLSDGTTGGQIQTPITVCNTVVSRSLQRKTTYYPTTGTIGDYVPLDMVVDDFDGDGTADVALPFSSSTRTIYSNKAGNQVAVLLGNGAGNFASSSTKYTLPVSTAGPWGICSGDFNADGNRDLAVSCYTASQVVVMYGDGNGGFPNGGGGSLNWVSVTLPSGIAPTGIQAYNFDRASGDDFVVCDGVGGQVVVYLSLGGGTSAPPAGFQRVATLTVTDPNTADSILPMCMDVAVANFDNDTSGGTTTRRGNTPDGQGLVDIAVTDYAHDRIVVFAADGIASWNGLETTAPVWTGGGAGSTRKPVGISAGYFGGFGDMSPDIVVANNGMRNSTAQYGISVLNNSGVGGSAQFSQAVEYGYSYYRTCYYWDVLAYDIDNDGWDDIAATARNVRPDLGLGGAHNDIYYSSLMVWRGLGNGSFYGFWSGSATGSRSYPGSRYWHPTAVDVIDFGGQTHGSPGAPLPDLVVANGTFFTGYQYYGKLVVYENRSN